MGDHDRGLPETVAASWRPRSEAWLERPPSAHVRTPHRPLFIGACPRSGTTLLRSMLDNHPDLAMPAETDFVIPLWKLRAGFGDLREEANRRAVARWVFREEGHGGTRLRAGRVSRKEAIRRVVAAPPTLGSLIEACFGVYAGAHGKRRWGDKRPAYAGRLAMLFALFPDAQFVNVVRDPRAAVASQLPLGWGEGDLALAAAAVRWENSIGRVDAHAARLRPDQLLDVRYEDLVGDPAATLAAVCAFARLPGGDAIATMIESERRGRFRPGWHDRLAEPVTTTAVDRWRERLDPHQVALVEHVARPHLERLGYRPSGVEAAPRERDLAALRRQRRIRRRKWRREALDELKRRHLLYRRPVAARREP